MGLSYFLLRESFSFNQALILIFPLDLILNYNLFFAFNLIKWAHKIRLIKRVPLKWTIKRTGTNKIKKKRSHLICLQFHLNRSLKCHLYLSKIVRKLNWTQRSTHCKMTRRQSQKCLLFLSLMNKLNKIWLKQAIFLMNTRQMTNGSSH